MWLIKQDRIAWELRRLHLSKERGDNFFRYMSEITRKTKSIGPILNGEGKLRTSDADMAKAFNDFLCDLMKPSSIIKNDWDKSYEPKERQLHIERKERKKRKNRKERKERNKENKKRKKRKQERKERKKR